MFTIASVETKRISLQKSKVWKCLVNLAQGFPDFPAPDKLKRAAASAIMEDYNPYSITANRENISCALRSLRKMRHYMKLPEGLKN